MAEAAAKQSAFAWIRNPKDFVGGLALIVIAAVALWLLAPLGGRVGIRLGPGTAPWIVAWLLGGVGVAIAIGALLMPGDRIPRLSLRGPLAVVVSILMFALTIRPLGLIIASFLVFTVSSLGSKETRLIESVVAGAILALLSALLFGVFLKLPFRLLPAF